MTAPICPTCAGRGTVTERLDPSDVLRVFDCPRGCPAPALPTIDEVEARQRAEWEALEADQRAFEAEWYPDGRLVEDAA